MNNQLQCSKIKKGTPKGRPHNNKTTGRPGVSLTFHKPRHHHCNGNEQNQKQDDAHLVQQGTFDRLCFIDDSVHGN